jgi:nucleotide-binding universal stress UspA family protein
MHVVIWIAEETWRACVRHARELLPEAAEVTLLHVAPSDVEELAAAGPAGLLGRRRPPPPPHERDLRTVSDEEAQQLLDAARTLLGRDCTTLARDGEHKLGPKSLGPRARFIVDHAPCTVVLVWAQEPPGITTIPPLPAPHHKRH